MARWIEQAGFLWFMLCSGCVVTGKSYYREMKYATNWKRLFPFPHIIIHIQAYLPQLCQNSALFNRIFWFLSLFSLSKLLGSHLYIILHTQASRSGNKMGSSIPPELTLDCSVSSNKPWIPRSTADFLAQLSRMDSVPEKISKLDNYVIRLQEEMKKIDAFKRELPLCMLLLNDGELLSTSLIQRVSRVLKHKSLIFFLLVALWVVFSWLVLLQQLRRWRMR